MDRYALLRRGKVEDIPIPLTDDSKGLDQLPIDGTVQRDPDMMDTDEDGTAGQNALHTVADYGIEVDFDELDDDLRDVSSSTLSESSC